MRRFTRVQKSNRALVALEQELTATSPRHVRVRAQMSGQLLRLRVKLSQALRDVPFSATQWKAFRNAFKSAMEEIGELEARLGKRDSERSAAVRELRLVLREREAAAGATATNSRR